MRSIVGLAVGTLFFCTSCSEPAFQGYTTAGTQIVDRATGEPVHLIGFGLGGWLLPEGYMWGIRTLDRPRQFEAAIEDLVGPEDAAEFWRLYHENFVTEPDFAAMKAMGANSVRIALLASQLMPREQPELPPYQYSEEGFRFLDSVVTWGARHGLGVIWDMHGAPGAQNAENISDSDGEARLWTEPDIYWPQLTDLWREIATRYAGNPWITGYDLLNEPLLRRYEGIDERDLRRLYVQLTGAIREIDSEGIIFIEGDDWAQNFSMLEPIDWDPHLALAFHSYPPTSSASGLARWDSLRQRYQVPLWHGETGEVTEPFALNRRSTEFLRAADVGWNWWTHKKISRQTQPWHCPATEGFRAILDYWQGTAGRPSPEAAKSWLLEQARQLDSRYCDFLPEMVASLDGLDPEGWLAIRPHEPPVILEELAAAQVSVGEAAHLYVKAIGYPLEYEWMRDGRPIPDGDQRTARLAPESAGDFGEWQVILRNELGADTSSVVRVVAGQFAGLSVGSNGDRWDYEPVLQPVAGVGRPVESDLSAKWAAKWDDEGLHGRVLVTDDILRNGDPRAHHNDGVELYLDLDNRKDVGYGDDDVQIRIVRGKGFGADRGALPEGFEAWQEEVEGGYEVTFLLPGAFAASPFLGLELQVVDNDNDRREHKIGWWSSRDNAYRSPAAFGTLKRVP